MSQLQWKNTDTGATQFMEFDAVLSESIELAAQITEHPVETGALVSDHSQPLQPAISMEVFVTDTPVTAPTTQNDGVTGTVRNLDLDLPAYPTPGLALPSGRLITNVIEGAIRSYSVPVLQFDGRLYRISNVFDTLESLLNSGTEITLVSTIANKDGQKTYDNLLLQRFSAPRISGQGSAAAFKLDFVRITKVSSKLGVDKPVPAIDRGKAKVDNGNSKSDAASAQNTAKVQSIAASLLESAGGLF